MDFKSAVKPFIPFNYYGGRPRDVPEDVAGLAHAGLDNLALQRFSTNFLMVGDVSTLSTMATIYRAKGKTHKASRILEHALSIEPESATLQVGYGETLLAMSNPGGAMQAFQAALERTPGHARTQALHGLAVVLKGQEERNETRVQDGLDQLEQVQSRKPGRPDLAALRSRALLQAGRYEDTIAFAAAFTPRRITSQVDCEQVASVHVNAGMAHMAQGDAGVPLSTPKGTRYGMAFQSFGQAAEWVSHLHQERSRVRGDDKLFNRLSRRSRGFNGHSHNLLIRIAGLKLTAAKKGQAPHEIESRLRSELKELTAVKHNMQQKLAKKAGFEMV